MGTPHVTKCVNLVTSHFLRKSQSHKVSGRERERERERESFIRNYGP